MFCGAVFLRIIQISLCSSSLSLCCIFQLSHLPLKCPVIAAALPLPPHQLASQVAASAIATANQAKRNRPASCGITTSRSRTQVNTSPEPKLRRPRARSRMLNRSRRTSRSLARLGARRGKNARYSRCLKASRRSPPTTSLSRFTRALTAGATAARAAPFAALTPFPSDPSYRSLINYRLFRDGACTTTPSSPISHFPTAVVPAHSLVLISPRSGAHMGGPSAHQRQTHAGTGICAPCNL